MMSVSRDAHREKTTARRDNEHLRFEFGAIYTGDLTVSVDDHIAMYDHSLYGAFMCLYWLCL